MLASLTCFMSMIHKYRYSSKFLQSPRIVLVDPSFSYLHQIFWKLSDANLFTTSSCMGQNRTANPVSCPQASPHILAECPSLSDMMNIQSESTGGIDQAVVDWSERSLHYISHNIHHQDRHSYACHAKDVYDHHRPPYHPDRRQPPA